MQLQRCHYTPPPPNTKPHLLRNINHACNFKDVITPHPHPTPNPTCYATSTMRATSQMSVHPTPTPPNTTCYIASTRRATSKMSSHPTPTQHQTPPVTQHQPCMQLQRCHYTPPRPPPNTTCYVASTMRATSKMSLHPTTTPTQHHVLHSISHACNFKDVITPHPHPTPNPTCYATSTMRATSKMSLHPTPTQHQTPPVRNINHACIFTDVITPHRTKEYPQLLGGGPGVTKLDLFGGSAMVSQRSSRKFS